MNKIKEFNYASFLCGSGKTYSAISHAIKLSDNHQRVVFAQPTIALIKETMADKRFDPYRACINAIYGNDGKGCVGERINNCLSNAEQGTILFQSHSSLLDVEYIPPEKEWHLFLDELPEITYCAQIQVDPKHNSEFCELLVLDNTIEYYAELKPNTLVEQIYSNKNKDIYWTNSKIQNLVSKIMSRHWSVYCDLDDYNRFVTGKSEWITIHGILKPTIFDGFKTVTILGAAMEESLLYKIWKSGVVFSRHPTIKPNYMAHTNSHLLSIKYCIEQNFSKTAREKLTSYHLENDDQLNLIDLMIMLVNARFPNADEYVWVANNDIPDHSLPGKRISSVSHGLNSYQHITKLAFLSALNETPKFRSFLGDITGIEPSEIYNSITLSSAYQTIMRTSIRDKSKSNIVEVIVPDKRCADLLKEFFFPNSTVSNLSGAQLITGKRGRPATGQKEKSEYERLRRDKKTQNFLHQIAGLNCSSGKNSLNNLKGINSSPDIYLSRNAPLDVRVELYSSRARPIPSKLATLHHYDFIELLKLYHAETPNDKEANELISPAIFDPNKSFETYRGNANIKYLNSIWLDNDGGDLGPDEFASIFPSWKMYIFNTYSSGKNGEKRWRCFIPITCMISPDVYKHITAQIRTRLANKKYYGKDYVKKNPGSKSHGFDESKLNTPCSLFFLPCQSAFGDSFFLEFTEGNRQFLNPFTYLKQIKTPIKQTDKTITLPQVRSIQEKISAIRNNFGESEIDRRINKFIQTAVSAPKGEQRLALRKLAFQLRSYGLTYHDRRRKLEQAANQMISSQERRAEIVKIMREI